MGRSYVAPGLILVTAPGAAADTYAFVYDDPTLYAFDFAGSDYVATRATKSSAGLLIDGLTTSIIYSDSSGLVGAGSLCFIDRNTLGTGDYTGTSIHVWDVLGDVIYNYSATGDWEATCPIYLGGKLYWAELDTTPDVVTGSFDVRLVRSNTDMTGSTVLDTHTFNYDATAVDNAVVGFGLAATSALCWVVSTNERRMIRFPLSGAASTARDDSADTYMPVLAGMRVGIGYPDISGNCVFAGGVASTDGPICYKHADNDSTAIVALWPTWADIGINSGDGFCGSMSTDQLLFQVSGAYNPAFQGDRVVRDLVAGTSDGAPDLIEQYNTNPPSPPGFLRELYFYYGG